MRWNKKSDTFTLTRHELADIGSLFGLVETCDERDEVCDWEAFEDLHTLIDTVLCLYIYDKDVCDELKLLWSQDDALEYERLEKQVRELSRAIKALDDDDE